MSFVFTWTVNSNGSRKPLTIVWTTQTHCNLGQLIAYNIIQIKKKWSWHQTMFVQTSRYPVEDRRTPSCPSASTFLRPAHLNPHNSITTTSVDQQTVRRLSPLLLLLTNHSRTKKNAHRERRVKLMVKAAVMGLWGRSTELSFLCSSRDWKKIKSGLQPSCFFLRPLRTACAYNTCLFASRISKEHDIINERKRTETNQQIKTRKPERNNQKGAPLHPRALLQDSESRTEG